MRILPNFRAVSLACVLSPAILFGTASAQDGLQSARFDLPQAHVRVDLPDDIRPGDTVSGSIVITMKVTGEQLTGHTISVDGRSVPLVRGLIRFVVGTGLSSLSLSLRDAGGSEVGRQAIALQPSGAKPPTNFELPWFGQNGRPLPIPGSFDGNFENTRCEVGAKPARVIAESPRKLIVRVPQEPTGSANITVSDRGVSSSGEFRNIGVRLSAPKTNLMKGETTTLTVEVTDLLGIKQSVALELVTTGSVNTEGGNTQQIIILPADVGEGGSITFTRTLTGITTGSFNISATISPKT